MFSALASLLFLAVCAYAGAALRGSADGVELMTVSAVTVTDSAELDGIVLRRERVLPRGAELVPAAGDGMRLPAGTAIEFADGTREHTGQSCVFFSRTDGFETLTPKAPEETDAEALDMLLAASPAESGRCGGRLVSGFDWYYAAYADAAGKSILPGERRVRFDGFEEAVSACTVNASNEGGRQFILLRLTEGGADYLSLRKTKAELVFSEHRGLKLPAQAVRYDADGTDYVYVLCAGVVERRSAELIYSDNDCCLADPNGSGDALREGERVILSGKDIYEGKVLTQ